MYMYTEIVNRIFPVQQISFQNTMLPYKIHKFLRMVGKCLHYYFGKLSFSFPNKIHYICLSGPSRPVCAFYNFFLFLHNVDDFFYNRKKTFYTFKKVASWDENRKTLAATSGRRSETVPSQDVTEQTLSSENNLCKDSRPVRIWFVTSQLGTRKSLTFLQCRSHG